MDMPVKMNLLKSKLVVYEFYLVYLIKAILLHQVRSAVVEKVTGVVGMKVAVPCNITPPNANDDVSLVLWYRGDTSNPLYSFDARRGNTNLGRHSPTDNLSDRAMFSVIDRPAVLILDPVLAGDAGTYKCRVDFRVARTRYSEAELSVIIPPNKPIVTDVNGKMLESLVGPYNEGQNLTFLCKTDGGKPLPSVSWWRESVLLDNTFEVITKDIVQNTIVIPKLERQHLMATFSCQALNNNQSLPRTSTVTVDMNCVPETLHNCTVTNQTDSSFRIECMEGYDGGMKQHFVMEVHDTTHNVIRANLTYKSPVFQATGLPSGVHFVAVLYGVNKKGRGEAVILRPGTLKVPETLTHIDTHWKATLNPLLIILSGIVGGLVFVALLIVCVIKYRSRNGNKQRKNRNERKEKDKYDEPDENLEELATRKKCPDIIPGVVVKGNRLRSSKSSNTYDDLKEDYDFATENLWTANTHLSESQRFEMATLPTQSCLKQDKEGYIVPQRCCSSFHPEERGVRVLPTPSVHTFIYDTGQSDILLFSPRQTDV
ncbi:uncharacterized protein LOC111084998 [Limulus polyphemus]|uniref:Uncharacterized protein LOC111084998 n=1 Tax=Limulus polyphemus TaxID=6850 RepID=A0ABM1S1T2_LIMPO|nr:uncharacterized protein LOC111084998 [Limulus polyphemus]